MLARYVLGKPKREAVNSCTPCRELIPTLGCRILCCRQFLVIVSQEDLDDGLELHRPFIDVLRRAPDGSCHYLDPADAKCTAWERRPSICRTYDCRVDERFEDLRKAAQPIRLGTLPDQCHHCGLPARLVYGSKGACDGHVVCADCGAPWRIAYAGPGDTCDLVAVQTTDAARARYRFQSLLYREQWAAALSELEAQMRAQDPLDEQVRQRALVLVELRRFAEAEAALAPLAARGLDGGDDSCQTATLDLAWLHTRTGRDAEARAVVEQLFPHIARPLVLRAHLLLGNIARRAEQLEEAARHYVAAERESAATGAHKDVTRQTVETFSSSRPEARAALERQRLLRITSAASSPIDPPPDGAAGGNPPS
jgi:hypothetical protein